MKIWIPLLFSILLFNTNVNGQLDIPFWSDVMMNANSPNNRDLALNEFKTSFESILEEGKGFDFDFKTTPELTVLSDSLNSFKLVTWQIQKSEKLYNYYGYIIHSDGRFYQLKDSH